MNKPKPIVSITIGNIMISEGGFTDEIDPNGEKIWLAHRDGEAGQFSRKKLAEVLEKFFTKEF